MSISFYLVIQQLPRKKTYGYVARMLTKTTLGVQHRPQIKTIISQYLTMHHNMYQQLVTTTPHLQ